MALDGAMLYLIGTSVLQEAKEARIEKIYQPTKTELIISLRGKGFHKNLLISALPSNARIHFTEHKLDNPSSPPMFCMLMRKHLSGGRLLAVRQEQMDRVLFLDFECRNELGDHVIFTLAVEIMGRHSNIILFDENKKIVDAIKRVGIDMSSQRQVLPGGTYFLPPSQNQKNILADDFDDVLSAILSDDGRGLAKAITKHVMGISPLLARELCFPLGNGEETNASNLSEAEVVQFSKLMQLFKENLLVGKSTPTVLLSEDGRLFDYTVMDVLQYGDNKQKRYFEEFHSLLDYYYVEQARTERMRSRTGELLKNVESMLKRVHRKMTAQEEDLLQTEASEEYRLFGDLITANIYAIEPRARLAVLQNYYEEDLPEIEIPLDTKKTAPENAQFYYTKYRKAQTAKGKLAEQIELGKEEIVYLESVLDALFRSNSDEEIDAIRIELLEGGYLKRRGLGKIKVKKAGFDVFVSSDGFQILLGKNNKSNDELSMKKSKKEDLWFHVKDMPGSHTVVVTAGEKVPEKTMQEAAMLAAYHSKGRESSSVPVDYTEIRYVKKPSGSKPGMVIYTDYKTIYTTPSLEDVEHIKRSK